MKTSRSATDVSMHLVFLKKNCQKIYFSDKEQFSAVATALRAVPGLGEAGVLGVVLGCFFVSRDGLQVKLPCDSL